jgi:hypothetical protein
MLNAIMDKLISELDDADLNALLMRVAAEQRRRLRQRQMPSVGEDRQASVDQ